MAVSRRVLWAAVPVAVVAGGGTAFALNGKKEERPAPAPSTGTATVERTSLAESRQFEGTLGYGAEQAVKGHGKGVVTWLPRAGMLVEPGRTLYRVDERPVVLLRGATPLYRVLDRPGLNGRDVAVVNANLRAYGAPGGDAFTTATREAIKRWQKRLGLKPTGKVGPQDAVVRGGPVRIAGVTAQRGDDASGELLTVTGTARSVAVEVEATMLGGVRRGTDATVTLPGGERVRGDVRAVGRVARAGQGDADGPAKITVTVGPRRAADLAGLDAANVQVTFATAGKEDVLAVPVAALVALREGGYALQVAGGGLVAVRTGVFADGRVEVSGDGIAEGVRVVTAS